MGGGVAETQGRLRNWQRENQTAGQLRGRGRGRRLLLPAQPDRAAGRRPRAAPHPPRAPLRLGLGGPRLTAGALTAARRWCQWRWGGGAQQAALSPGVRIDGRRRPGCAFKWEAVPSLCADHLNMPVTSGKGVRKGKPDRLGWS
jgi:hypothetical protein